LIENVKDIITNEIWEDIKKYVNAKTARLLTLFYAQKKEEVKKELKNIRKFFNAKAYFKTTISSLLKRRKPEAFSFSITFPIKKKFKDGFIIPSLEGECYLDENGKYKIGDAEITVAYYPEKTKNAEVEIACLNVDELSSEVKPTVGFFLNVMIAADYEDLEEVIEKQRKKWS
jgi:hypothetical protein